MPELNEENLRYYYKDEDLTQREVADKYSVSRGKIRNCLDKWSIETGHESAQITKKELKKLYIEKNLTGEEIADIFDRNGTSWTQYYLDKWNIEKSEEKKEESITRRKHEAWIEKNVGTLEEFKNIVQNSNTIAQVANKLETSRNTVYSNLDYFGIEFNRRYEKLDDYGLLYDLYVEKDLSLSEIARMYNCNRGVVRRRLVKHDIEIKSITEVQSGKTHSSETKRKMRKTTIQNLREKNGDQFYPNYNPEACSLIENYGEKHGYGFQHAKNGGEYFVEELGYWVDGYDEEENVVVEVYEDHHYKDGELKERDKRREEEIKQFLNCEIIQIKL